VQISQRTQTLQRGPTTPYFSVFDTETILAERGIEYDLLDR